MEDTPSREILQCQFDENQKLVQQLANDSISRRAAFFQRKGIQQKRDLAKARSVPHDFTERSAMEETLADILLATETMDGRNEARDILQNLLQEEVRQEKELQSEDRRCRLYHSLGRIAFDQRDAETARKFLGRAFEGRRKLVPMPMDLVAASGGLLVMALQLDQAFDEARGYREWMRKNLPHGADTIAPAREPYAALAGQRRCCSSQCLRVVQGSWLRCRHARLLFRGL